MGVFIDSHLKWDKHVNYVIKKLQAILYKFRYLSKILKEYQLKVLYHALVESHLNYCILGWGGVVKTYLAPLEILQKRFLKLIMNKELTYPTDLLYKESKVLDIRQLYYFNINLKYHSTKSHASLSIHTYNTRQRNRYIIPFMQKTLGQRSYIFLAPRAYNTVPKEIQTTSSFHLFKKKLKMYILNKPRDIVQSIIDLKNNG